jgi:hypothetical protein
VFTRRSQVELGVVEAHHWPVSSVRRLACLVRGGHRWETTTDVAGSITTCGRCGTVKHSGMSGRNQNADVKDVGHQGG